MKIELQVQLLLIVFLLVIVIFLWNKTNNLQSQFDNGTLTNDQGWSVEIQPPDIVTGNGEESVVASYIVNKTSNGKTVVIDLDDGITSVNFSKSIDVVLAAGFFFQIRNIELSAAVTVTYNNALMGFVTGSACQNSQVPANSTVYCIWNGTTLYLY